MTSFLAYSRNFLRFSDNMNSCNSQWSLENGCATKRRTLITIKVINVRLLASMAGVEGIEPSLKVLETSVMPFDHTPVCAAMSTQMIITKKCGRVNRPEVLSAKCLRPGL